MQAEPLEPSTPRLQLGGFTVTEWPSRDSGQQERSRLQPTDTSERGQLIANGSGKCQMKDRLHSAC